MGGATTRVPMSQRVLSPSHNYGAGDYPAGSDQPAVLLSGSIFRFLEEETNMFSSPETDGHTEIQNDIEDDDENQNPERIEDKIKFWETQHQSLHSTLYRTTSLESKIRSLTKEVAGIDGVCSCSRVVSGSCRSCRMREICSRLAISGYNSAICKSKWKSSVEIRSGEHTFVDVIDNSNSKKGEVRVIIELEFRGQFEMKKGSEEYNDLVSKLPEIFVGKIERLQTVIKILSNAAKRCMKEKKMHLGPWRKQKYVEAKWLRVVDRNTCMSLTTPLMAVDTFPIRKTRARESMLTTDLLDNFHMYTSVVEVL